jgi:Tol biopolymer transport system component
MEALASGLGYRQMSSAAKTLASVIAANVLAFVLLASPGHAAFPGANGRIAFNEALDNPLQIHLLNPDGTGKSQLTTGSEHHFAPAWSADGQRLALILGADVAVMNGDGTDLRQVTSGSRARCPAWSPDGTRLAFGTAAGTIHVVNVDGTGQTPVPHTDLSFDCPSWSPDGAKLAFGGPSGPDENRDIFTVHMDGTALTQVTFTEDAESRPDWSPHGTMLAYVKTQRIVAGGEEATFGTSSVAVVNGDGTDIRDLTFRNGDIEDRTPAWSPDGTKIVFSSTNYRYESTDLGHALETVAVADGTINRIYQSAQVPHSPSWQPLPVARSEDYKNRSTFCKAEQKRLGGEFRQVYRNFGACVSRGQKTR